MSRNTIPADHVKNSLMDALYTGFLKYKCRYYDHWTEESRVLECCDLENIYSKRSDLLFSYFSDSRDNALQVAIQQSKNHAGMIEALFEFAKKHNYRGADITWGNAVGENALHTAARSVVRSKKTQNREGILTILLMYAPEEDIAVALKQVNTTFEQSPLLLAYEHANIAAIEAFERVGADWQAIDNRGYTVLHTAVIAGNLELIKRLCDQGMLTTLLNLQTKNGDTALHIAARLGKSDIADYLLMQRADTTIENKQYLTPLRQAIREEQHDVLRIIATHLQYREEGSPERSIALSFAAVQLLKYMNTRCCRSNYFHWLQSLFHVGYSKTDKITAAGKYLGQLFTVNCVDFEIHPILLSPHLRQA